LIGFEILYDEFILLDEISLLELVDFDRRRGFESYEELVIIR
jgi:hypothetical protein